MAGKTRPSLMAKTLTNVALSNLSLTDKKCIEEVFKKFEVLTSADVVEVKHGEWIVAEECKIPLSHGYIRTEKTYICPFCHYHFRKKMKYCGECGAKMDGGKARNDFM